MNNLTVNISQVQAVMFLAQAQTSLNVAVQALQQAIAAAQAAGSATVTFSTAALQEAAAQVQAAADALVQARTRQMQQIMVRIRGEEMIRVRARQMQITNVLVQARTALDASLRVINRLIAMAQAMGGMVAVSLADAQQLLAGLQTTLTSVAQAAALQMQQVMISGSV